MRVQGSNEDPGVQGLNNHVETTFHSGFLPVDSRVDGDARSQHLGRRVAVESRARGGLAWNVAESYVVEATVAGGGRVDKIQVI